MVRDIRFKIRPGSCLPISETVGIIATGYGWSAGSDMQAIAHHVEHPQRFPGAFKFQEWRNLINRQTRSTTVHHAHTKKD